MTMATRRKIARRAYLAGRDHPHLSEFIEEFKKAEKPIKKVKKDG